MWQITEENRVGVEWWGFVSTAQVSKRHSDTKDQSACHIVGTQGSFISSSSPTHFSSWKQNPGRSGFHHFQMPPLPMTCRAMHVDVPKPGISGGKSAVRWTHWILRSCFHVNSLSHEMWGKRKYNVLHECSLLPQSQFTLKKGPINQAISCLSRRKENESSISQKTRRTLSSVKGPCFCVTTFF